MKKIFRKHLWRESSKSQPKEIAPVKDTQDIGLKVVYVSETPSVDIVVIHGHGGHWKKSWTYTQEDGTDTFWLHDFLPNILPTARILSFGYDASDALKSSVEDIASHFLGELVRIRSETRTVTCPLLFIAHCFGGMLLKGTLGLCEGLCSTKSLADLRLSTQGILFLGVPNEVKFLTFNLESAMPGSNDLSDSPLIAALKQDLRWLQEHVGRFDQISDGFFITNFLESDGTSIFSQVPSGNAQKRQTIRLNKTHGMMARYASADDDDYRKISACLEKMVEQASQQNDASLHME